MALSGGALRRLLDWAYLDYHWGAKKEAMAIIHRIIEEVETQDGETPKQTDSRQAREARKEEAAVLKTHRERLRRDFEKRWAEAERRGGSDIHLF